MVGHFRSRLVVRWLARIRPYAVALLAVGHVLFLNAPATRADITTGLVGHWKLNETSGTTASDSSGNGRNGTYTNSPTLNQSGQCSTAVSFDGVNDYVTIPDNADFSTHTSTGQTVAGWVKVTTIPSSSLLRAPIAAKGNTNAWEWAFYVYRYDSTHWYPGASYWQQDGSTHNEIGGNNYTTGTWVYMVMTYQSGTVKLYVNGVLEATGSTPTGSAYDGTQPVQIGRREDGKYLNAVIDDVRIYKRALSAADVTELYGLILYQKLDETSGTTASGSSMYERPGTVTGTATWIAAVRSNGFLFNGSTKIQTSGLLGNPTSFTVAAWANLTAADTSGAEVISIGDDILLRLDEPGGTCRVSFYNGSTWVTTSYSATYAGTGWHHFAGVFDNSGDTLKLYIDGVLVSTTATTANIAYTAGGTNTFVGCHGNGQTTFDFTGTIDDVRVYSYALTAAQIAELYGLVGYWKLNEASGTTAADSSGIGNNGTVHGTATWTSAIHGNGFSCDYTNGEDYIQIANSTSLENVQESSYSLAAWFKPTNLPPGTNSDNTAGYRIVGKAGWHLGLIYDNAGDFFVEHWLGTTPTWNGAGAWYMNAPGKWYHVAGVVDRDAGTIKLYLNGSLAETTTFTAGAAAYEYGTEPWRIGVSYPAATNWGHAARGTIDDVRIYNRAIKADEVTKLAGLLGYWKMNEGTGTTAADSSGLANNATLSGGASWTTDCAGNNNALLTNGTGGIAATGSKFTPPDEGTVAFWMRSTGTPAGTARIMGNGADWEIRQINTGSVITDLCGDGSTTIGTVTPLTEVGRWYHVAMTFDSADDTYAIYVDGQLEKSGTNPSPMVQQPAGILSFGTRTGTTEYWSGALRDVRVYNRKLFPFEIAQLYGLLGRWKLTETTGTTATDNTLLANNGTYTNGVSLASSTLVPGTAEIAAKFDGTDDYVSVPNESDYDITGPITVAAWICADTFTGTHREFVSKGGFAWRLRYRPDLTQVSFKCTGLTTEEVLSSGKLLPNRWYHIAGVYTGSALQLYVNGTLNNSVSTSGSISTNNYVVNIGRNAEQTGREFDGAIYDARVYNRALCPTEISRLYGSAFTGVKIIKWEEIQ